jgi:single-strand DNA-binding protein
MSINKVILIGNVGKDPEIRTMNNGNEVALFNLATSDYWRDKTTGERKDKTEWHRIVIYSQGLVNIIKNHVHKGTKLYISGSIQTRRWVDQSGLDKHATEIILQGYTAELQILEQRNTNNNVHRNNYDENYYSSITKTNEGEGEAETNTEDEGHINADNFIEESVDDEIPF